MRPTLVLPVPGHVSHLCLAGDWCALFQEHIHHSLVPGPRRAMQRRQAVARLGIDVGVLIQQQSYHVALAPLGCNVEGGNLVLEWETEGIV